MIRLEAKRLLIPALMVGLVAPIALIGCGENSENKTKIEQTSPTGTTTEERTDKVHQTGSNPPPPVGATDAAPPK